VRQRRILLLITDLRIGGTPTVVRELALRLGRDKSASVAVACLDRWGAVADQIRAGGVHVTALGTGSKRDPRIFLRLVDLIHRERFDTVLSFLVHANAMAAGASFFCRRTRFLQSIQTTQPWPRWHWMLQDLAARRAEMVVVPSPSVAAAAGEWAGISMDKIAVIPNAVEVGEFVGVKNKEPSPRPSPGVPGEGEKVGFIGRLDPVKRVGDLVAAVASMGEDVSLHIYGEGPERGRIEQQIEQLGLGERAILHGEVTGAAAALAQIDLLVLPSVAEGFGLVLIEAMVAGVPVVASNAPGIRDVVTDGENGLLAPPCNPRELARAIGRVLGDADLRQRLISGGERTVREQFSWERVYPMYRRLLRVE
jgi:glycosyltransferase involved in cell wall biosynthesis